VAVLHAARLNVVHGSAAQRAMLAEHASV
jgi:hypothetical protein